MTCYINGRKEGSFHLLFLLNSYLLVKAERFHPAFPKTISAVPVSLQPCQMPKPLSLIWVSFAELTNF